MPYQFTPDIIANLTRAQARAYIEKMVSKDDNAAPVQMSNKEMFAEGAKFGLKDPSDVIKATKKTISWG